MNTMFQYEYEKRPASANSCDSRATMSTDWSRGYTSPARTSPNVERATRPLPPRPIVCERIPTKTTVPLKVWIIASASCFAVCAALVLATLVITKWGASSDTYTTRELFVEPLEHMYSNYPQPIISQTTETHTESSEEIDNEIQMSVLEKLSVFKNVVANREKKPNLISKPQIHPAHDTIHHAERKIEKKDQAKLPDSLKNVDLTRINRNEANKKIVNEFNDVTKPLPDFKPILPDILVHRDIKLPEGYVDDLKNNDYEEYYNDENLYDDYMQSNSMTSYLIEKVQELHNWITTDPDFEVKNTSKKINSTNDFGHLLKALNDSLLEGNVSIVMNKLRDIYFGDNSTEPNHNRKIVLSNSTDLLSFGILTLDIMLLHNIQLMAWDNQEAARTKMLKDPDVFAFNALFLDPSKVEAKQNDVQHNTPFSKRQNLRQESLEDFDFGKNLFENVLEIGMSAARAAINLGRAYKNTRNILMQISNKEATNANIHNQISRNIDGNTHALNHLQTSFNKNDSSSAANSTSGFYTELDCVWLLYCRNLVATAKLNPPYGTMARINGMALRMLAGELSADRALDTMLYEVMTGWTELKCNDMFPRCSKANAASVVMETILQPMKKSQSTNRGR